MVNYETLVSTMESVRQGRDEYAAKANGLLSHLESFNNYFALRLAEMVFAPAEQFSVNLQAKNTLVSLSACQRGSKRCQAPHPALL